MEFAKADIEARFWELVALADWPNKDYDKVKIMYRKSLTKEQCAEFRMMINKAYAMLDNALFGNTNIYENLGVGDDGYGDLLHHIIGLGKEQFYKHINDLKLIEKLAHSNGYKESFAYCIPYDDDYSKHNRYTIEYVVSVAKSAVEEIKFFDKMDIPGDEMSYRHLKAIEPEMGNISLAMRDFIRHPTEDGLRALLSHKEMIERASKKIDKFFEKNYMELPRKFTEPRKNGNNFNGMCTALFTNSISDAEEVLEYMK